MVSIEARMIQQNIDATAHQKEEIEEDQQMGDPYQKRIAWLDSRVAWDTGIGGHECLHCWLLIQPARHQDSHNASDHDDHERWYQKIAHATILAKELDIHDRRCIRERSLQFPVSRM